MSTSIIKNKSRLFGQVKIHPFCKTKCPGFNCKGVMEGKLFFKRIEDPTIYDYLIWETNLCLSVTDSAELEILANEEKLMGPERITVKLSKIQMLIIRQGLLFSHLPYVEVFETNETSHVFYFNGANFERFLRLLVNQINFVQIPGSDTYLHKSQVPSEGFNSSFLQDTKQSFSNLFKTPNAFANDLQSQFVVHDESIGDTIDLTYQFQLLFDKEAHPMSLEKWKTLMETNGSFSTENAEKARRIIFSAGIIEEAIPIVFPFILGRYKWDSTEEERKSIKLKTFERYQVLKEQWKSIDADQLNHCRSHLKYQSLIHCDAIRTDRMFEFFDNSERGERHVAQLEEILMTYYIYNRDVKYMQGMNDIAGAFFFICGDETEAFWWFQAFMERYAGNFVKKSESMQNQQKMLLSMITLLDPQLANFFQKMKVSDLYFCFRWILVLFKREFDDFSQFLRMLESILSCERTSHFSLFVCAYLITQKSNEILSNKSRSYDTVLTTFAGDQKLTDAQSIVENAVEIGNKLLITTPQNFEELYSLCASLFDLVNENKNKAVL